MLEFPGLTSTGDVRADVDKIQRYLVKLVPQLEMELANAQQDEYSNQMNALRQGVGTADPNSTAGALASHEMRTDNPHKVTAEQLGLTLNRLVKIRLQNGGLVARIGETKGVQINVQGFTTEVGTWTQKGGVCWADVTLDAWDEKIPVLYWAGVSMDGSGTEEVWAGPLKATTGEQMGTVRIFHTCDISVLEGATNTGTVTDVKTVKLTVLGLGVFGYGGE